MAGLDKPLAFAQLHCVSNFTFLTGASWPEELVEQAQRLGYHALAITDECSLAGAVRAWQSARDLNVKLIIGARFLYQDHRLVLLAQNRDGYAQLSRLISRCRMRAEKGCYQLTLADLTDYPFDQCLLLLAPAGSDQQALALAASLAANFTERSWWLWQRYLEPQDLPRERQLRRLAKQNGWPLVAAHEALYHEPERAPLQQLLTVIRLNTRLDQAGEVLHANRERVMQPLSKLRRLYTEQALAESVQIAQRCRFQLDELRYEYPAELVPKGLSAHQHLRNLVQAGARQRFAQGVPEAVAAQLERELGVIGELAYEHYFLTVEDIVSFARRQKILCQGRGSAANSVVCYCLGITEVNPQEVNLLFERFISKERNEPPDIDVDFEHQRREEVMQYIYRKYGRQRAGLAAAVNRYRCKSVIRDVGKALGMEPIYLQQLIKQLDRRDEQRHWIDQLRGLAGETPSGVFSNLVTFVDQLRGFPRHLSQHTGGFVIAAEDLTALVPVENARMAERSLVQWDKDDLEALGLLKIDVLALGMLSAIRRALGYISQRLGHPFTMQDIPREDPETYRLLSEARTVGVFQVESRAQMSMLPRLKPRSYYDLVIEVALVRPGPIQGDMVHPYLKRRNGEEPVEYPSEAVKQVLARTLGVPIFQEQVIQLAMVAAGFSGGEADQLRRAMAAWKRSGSVKRYQQKLVDGMLLRGYSAEFAARICRQIEGFGEYGFPESHAASFALLVYVSAWLKQHQPAAFYAGLLNSQPMGFYSAAELIQDGSRHGVHWLPVDINHSDWEHRPIETASEQVRLGLLQVKGLNEAVAQKLIAQRPAEGYRDLQHLKQRVSVDRGSLERLAAAGAFSCFGQSRYQARWEMMQQSWDTPLLEAAEAVPVALPQASEVEELEQDYLATSLSLRGHPVELLRQQGLIKGCTRAVELPTKRDGQTVQVAGVVTHRQRPGTATGVTFVSLEDESGKVNLVVWRDTAKAQRQALISARLLQVAGVLQREGEVIHVVAGRLTDISHLWEQLAVRSRDFR